MMFVRLVYGCESECRLAKFSNQAATVSDILRTVSHGCGCALQLYCEHNVLMTTSELVENCRVYVVKRKPCLLDRVKLMAEYIILIK